MEQLTMGEVELSYGIPLTVDGVCKVNKVRVYPMNGVHHIHIISGYTTQNNSNICNIYFPNIFIRVIN